MIRLQKFLSQQGVCSRREAEAMIHNGAILINGAIATLGDKVDGSETILINGKKLEVRQPEKIVLAWNKPTDVEITFDNSHGGKTLKSFDFGPERVVPVGRLDKDSYGLILLTNDGDLCNFLAHPRYVHDKEYVVTVNRDLKDADIDFLREGVIKVENKNVKPCIVEKTGSRRFTIILEEGRNRQIRKMCEACGMRVMDLKRVRVKNIQLGDLRLGEWRKLSPSEVEGLREKKD